MKGRDFVRSIRNSVSQGISYVNFVPERLATDLTPIRANMYFAGGLKGLGEFCDPGPYMKVQQEKAEHRLTAF